MNTKTNLVVLITLIITVIFSFSCKKKNNNLTGNIVKDIDGNVYHTVKIGTQVWMIENLKTTRYRNGDLIPDKTDSDELMDLTSGAYCYYNDTTRILTNYGNFYNWYAVDDKRNIAPEGWHIATDMEWTILIDFLGGEDVAGGKLKEKGTSHWNEPNTGANNETGFTALPDGPRHYYGSFTYERDGSDWWTSTEANAYTAYGRSMEYNSKGVRRFNTDKNGTCAVRCIKD